MNIKYIVIFTVTYILIALIGIKDIIKDRRNPIPKIVNKKDKEKIKIIKSRNIEK